MKLFILFFLIISRLIAKEEITLTIGGGAYIKTQPYKQSKDLVLPSPVIFYENSIAYIRWSRVGVYFAGQKKENFSWGLSLTAMPRTYGYDDISGMQERKNSWEGGISFAAKKKDTYFELLYLDDILNGKDRYVLQAEIGSKFKVAKMNFYPAVFAIYQSKNFLNYYYGIEQNEVATSGFFEFHPNGGILYGAQTYISYPLTKKLSIFSNIRIDKIPSSVQNSPLVTEDFIYSGILSLLYTFKI